MAKEYTVSMRDNITGLFLFVKDVMADGMELTEQKSTARKFNELDNANCTARNLCRSAGFRRLIYIHEIEPVSQKLHLVKTI